MGFFRTDILEEHADEAAFLCRLREHAFDSWSQSFASLFELEERLLAHLDGLVVAGEGGWSIARKTLSSKDTGEAFVAAYTALSWGGAVAVEELSLALEAPPTSQDGVRLGLRLARGARVEEILKQWASVDPPRRGAWAADALAFRGLEIADPAVRGFLESDQPDVLRAGLEIAGRRRDPALRPPVEKALGHKDPLLAATALRAGLLLGSPRAREAAREWVPRADRPQVEALSALALCAGPEAFAVLASAVKEKSTARAATLALGRHGAPKAAELLVGLAAQPSLARIAGHALRIVLGIDLEAAGLVKTADAPVAGGGAETQEEDDLDVDPDLDLPMPDAEKLVAWWRGLPAADEAGPRLRAGAPFSWKIIAEQVGQSRVPDREAAILESLFRLPEVDYIEPRAWCRDQAKVLPLFLEQTGQSPLGAVDRGWPQPAERRGSKWS